ncbi:protein disulfide oxidoreductase [Thiohalocapsa marina]|uniref:Protein disulfide oxidoreductase n=1 Tax=Thiohalocapsa marina TaxID=424902 RepID=A0A5M8FJL4_9GAMM|nr:protein disulfide oxidoreductase [Thiohalocapsa marina]KAA6184170.1 protein disulfide oxidoreductase [Thiohalocapsa marina]
MTPSSTTPTPRRWQRARGWLINLLIVIVVYFGIQWYQSRSMASDDAPDLRGTTLAGESFDLRNWRGQPVLVHFWAVWCPVCKLQAGAIEAVSQDHAVITVAMQSGSRTEVDAYLQQQGLRFATIPDPSGAIASAWGVHAVPASFILDGAGEIRFTSPGYSTGAGLRGRLWAASQLD